MPILDPTLHPRGGDLTNVGRFSERVHSAPDITLATGVDEPYTFVTEAEIRDALPMLRTRDGLPAPPALAP